MLSINNDWSDFVQKEWEKPYFQELIDRLRNEYKNEMIFPNQDQIFHALECTSYADTKVVILGQDPYHGAGQADGLSFSVQKGVTPPPSLRNIFKEMHADLGFMAPSHGCLTQWAEQGVLLLNTVLTVRSGQPHSHKGMGWETFTDKIISLLNDREDPVIFILWGKHAQEKEQLITAKHHFVIQSPHPSPFSAHRGFFGSRPFSRTNRLLRKIGKSPIHWQLS
ncbi:uracil-DNA glycosylase [Ammoniphilus sp. CFH 90114]|uniref:uracil-DNA glycosylase n=1 Tax=Ammoniphilus sp. CFH 90114 TaxID=2493665 RepID=UPI00100E3B19|nr:uracil-DNA glycosylase [Ammoniphilus sp. CFH 90114]RXT02305.1 uracil-DNA glycosylase [Ammoniphilus sp. CFH 90114]